eukprot:Colp12_sorted_trinity150504_noHs@3927
MGQKRNYVVSIDQGTSSSRVVVFDVDNGDMKSFHQIEVVQQFPKEGWVEMDPMAILESVTKSAEIALEKAKSKEGISLADIKAIGITNQRETTVVWDKTTGKPLANAIIWLDARTAETVDELLDKVPERNRHHFQDVCGLPISTYFSALKLRWLMDNVPAVREGIKNDTCLFGTIDTWLIWNITGGVKGGVHVTDVTNASRTMLMNLKTLAWDPEQLAFFGIPSSVLPRIASSAEVYGHAKLGILEGVPVSGCLGDQSAALVGQLCFNPGDAKNTYGTGCFLLYNTGSKPVTSRHGLLTTLAYKFGSDEPVYALEGSIAIAGAAVRWCRDNLGIIKDSKDIGTLAETVADTGDCYFVPAFSGLYAPHWRTDARGVIVGLTQFTNKAHIARAALEAVCFQTREIIDAMYADCSYLPTALRVDGGMTANQLLMQTQADVLGLPVVRPALTETTAYGAAIAAAVGCGLVDYKTLLASGSPDVFTPKITKEARDRRFDRWLHAIERSLGWHVGDHPQYKHQKDLFTPPLPPPRLLSWPLVVGFVGGVAATIGILVMAARKK